MILLKKIKSWISQRKDPTKFLAISLGLTGGLCFVTAMSMAKQISPSVSNWTLLFFRSLFSFIFLAPFFLKKSSTLVKTDRKSLHVTRVIFSCISIACTYYTYRNISMAEAASIGYTGPLFTYLLSFFLLKETIRFQQWLAIIVGYLGVLVIFQPHITGFHWVIGIALLGNMSASMSIICSRALTKTESFLTLLFFSTSAALVFSGLIVSFVWEMPSFKDISYLLFMAFFASLSNMLYLLALKRAQSSLLASLGYTRLLFALTTGMLFFREIPSWTTCLGGVIILGATYWATKKGIATAQN